MRATTDLLFPYEVRAHVYRLLATLYLSPPDSQTLDALRDPSFITDWPLGRGIPDVEAGLARLAEALPNATASAIQAEFWQLFGSLGPAAAPPWQSVYLDREPVLMGEETLRVRALFARYGLASTLTGQQPDDHIGLQLQFLSTMAARTADRLAADDHPGARHLLEGQHECLTTHLLRWTDRFVARVEAASTTEFYAGIARLTLGVLRYDQDQARGRLAEGSLI